eukprot:TRINITY_DN580_c0_g1_i1.p1 TRINITY_DN580_c0_g1~~TRINITY_DN580_c0_g1_i1.p1  ORF type:complete len:289 (+),score=47.07 TRINITY_DN580_c0_g1_i1:123-989(+)
MAARVRRTRASGMLRAVVTLCAVCSSTTLLGLLVSDKNGASLAATGANDRHRGADDVASENTIPIFGKWTKGTPVDAARDLSGQYVNPVPETRHVREWTHHVMRRIGRFQERWIGPVNFDRQGLRISAQDSYALVAVVLVQVVIGLYGATAPTDDKASGFRKRLYETQVMLLMIATMTSTFTMVLFLLSKVYCVTALSFWKDVAYNTFHTSTEMYRNQAFWSMLVSTACFMLSFCLNLGQRVKGIRGYMILIMAVVLLGYFLYNFKIMMDVAEEYVFTSYPDDYRSLA